MIPGRYNCTLSDLCGWNEKLIPVIVISISYYQPQSTISVLSLKTPSLVNLHRGQTHQIIHTTTIGCSVQVQPANSSLVDWGVQDSVSCPYLLRWRQIKMPVLCLSDNWQWSPGSPLLPQRAEEVLLWLFPPGVTSERMRISAASSLFHPRAFTAALCPGPG